MEITDAQRAALERIASRWGETLEKLEARMSPVFGGNGAIAVRPTEDSTLWLCIETDGHTHS